MLVKNLKVGMNVLLETCDGYQWVQIENLDETCEAAIEISYHWAGHYWGQEYYKGAELATNSRLTVAA